jgi:thymidylate synthase (FAD)
MKVTLHSYSQPAGEILGLETVQDLIAHAARVSNPSNQFNTETTRDIARQILRHRSFAFQEFSQRYADPAEFGNQFELREARLQDEKNRQNSIDVDDRELQRNWEIKQQMVINASKEAYEWAIANGIAKEQARAVLPEGNTKSRLYMNGTLRSWIHYIELRSANGTQKEHMEVAHAVAEAITKIFPLAENYIGE